jgi:NADH-quinone oxidoreductase subunit E
MNTDEFKVLTKEMVEQIEALLPRYPEKQAVALPAVHIVNSALRYVPLEAVVEISKLLDLAPADVQDMLTFYGFFKQDRPHGRTRAWVCRSISCHLRGAEELLDHLCEKSRIRPGQTTEDGRVTIEYAECLGACEHAPCILADDQLHKSVTKEDADELLRSWK